MSALVAVIMGSASDWETMQHCSQTLEALGIEHDARAMSAHRTPDLVAEYIGNAEANGLEVIIAAAGGAAHLAGVSAAHTTLPVLGVPMPMASPSLNGLDSLLSTVQMPAGVPVGTFAIGKAGAVNAALFAAAILSHKHPQIKKTLKEYRANQTKRGMENQDPRKARK